MKKKLNGDDIDFIVAISYVDETAICADQQFTMYPDGLEKVPPKFAISKRNDWLISKSDIVIVYVKHHFSNSYKWMEKAKKKGAKVINLYHENIL